MDGRSILALLQFCLFPEGNTYFCNMLHYVQQIVDCLLFGAKRVEYSGVLELFHFKQLLAVANDAMRVNQNIQAVP